MPAHADEGLRTRLNALWRGFDGGDAAALVQLEAIAAEHKEDAALHDFVYRLREAVREVILSWGPNSLKLRRAAVAALLATAQRGRGRHPRRPLLGPVRQEPTRPAGRLPENARIALRAGDPWSCSTAGGTRTFRGPGTFSRRRAAADRHRTVAAADGRRARIGAVRSVGIGELRPPTHLACRRRPGARPSASPSRARSRCGGRTRARRRRSPSTAPGGSPTQCAMAGRAGDRWPGRPALPIADGAAYRLPPARSRRADADQLPDAAIRARRARGHGRGPDRATSARPSSTCSSRPSPKRVPRRSSFQRKLKYSCSFSLQQK